jgi:uncharacterized ion transporter superfamily protein YfcC
MTWFLFVCPSINFISLKRFGALAALATEVVAAARTRENFMILMVFVLLSCVVVVVSKLWREEEVRFSCLVKSIANHKVHPTHHDTFAAPLSQRRAQRHR